MQGIVKVADIDKVSVEQTLVLPSELLSSLLGNQEPASQLLGLHLKETGKLAQIHGGVKSQVGLDCGAPHVDLDLLHEDSEMVLKGINVGLGVVKIRGNRGDELGASSAEELLEDGEGLGAAALQLEQLVTILLPQSTVDGVIQSSGLEGNADGNQGVHLLVLLGDGVVLGVLLEVLGP